MIRIVTDSTADLPPDLVEKHHITVVPLTVTVGDRSYADDGVALPHREFYQLLRTSSVLPKTSQPSVGQFQQVFREITAAGDEVICLTISAGLSGTYASAKAAAESLPDMPIHVLDTRLVSVGLGQPVLQAARAAAAGQSVEEIMALVGKMCRSYGLVFTLVTLRYVYMGGRIGRAENLVGTLLDIKPLMTFRDGVVHPIGRVRGRKNVRGSVMKALEEQVPAGTTVLSGIVHTDNIEDAEWAANAVRERYDCREVYIAEMGPVVGTYGGPGMFGVAVFPV